jgi:glycosyltransferase involved in cell wall biosynthesis
VVEHDFSDTSFRSLWRLRRLISRHRISSAYLTDKPTYSLYFALLRSFGIRRIVVHDHTPGERPATTGWRRGFKSALFKLPAITPDLCIGVSKFVFRRLIDNACVPRDRATYVLNGIVPIDSSDVAREYVRAEFGLPKDALVVVSTGRATRYKGIDFMVRCAARVIGEPPGPNAFFLHCGDGPDLEMFRQLVADAGLVDRFVLAGRRTDVRKILPGCDVALQASMGEAFSLSILEYLSAGLATVVPDSCGNPEAVETGVTGLLYEPGNLEDAASKIGSLLADAALRDRLGSAGRLAVERQFNIARANRELIDVLDSRL